MISFSSQNRYLFPNTRACMIVLTKTAVVTKCCSKLWLSCCACREFFQTESSLNKMSWASLSPSVSLPLPISLMRLIAPQRCVMSAQAFLLALLMWQFEGRDYLVSRVTDGCRRGGALLCLSHSCNQWNKHPSKTCSFSQLCNVCRV